ncbi:hypothetical protein LTR36_001662 [Oleoguttula mirabilis]|uniref:Uncharacterized protein n=1 Tax=Oleoguttula mirabilis TaxID=1507867 RepID=A0AAV9JN04_9PEZI|nr:hypothetical protein LTR36_001662 [Oleoguttula mirabilis]
MAASDIDKLQDTNEPERTTQWLRACSTEAPASTVTHADLCQAYRLAFAPRRHLLKTPMIQPDILLDTVLKTFGSASLQGVAFEKHRAAYIILQGLQADGLEVPGAVWKWVKDPGDVFRAADDRMQEMRRTNKIHWVAHDSKLKQARFLI